MRTSTESADRPAGTDPRLKEEPGIDWHPDRISDRDLLELNNRLERVRQLGGAFATVRLSDEAKARLDRLSPTG